VTNVVSIPVFLFEKFGGKRTPLKILFAILFITELISILQPVVGFLRNKLPYVKYKSQDFVANVFSRFLRIQLTHTMALISFERWAAIAYPIWYRRQTLNGSLARAFLVSTFGIVFSIGIAYYGTTETVKTRLQDSTEYKFQHFLENLPRIEDPEERNFYKSCEIISRWTLDGQISYGLAHIVYNFGPLLIVTVFSVVGMFQLARLKSVGDSFSAEQAKRRKRKRAIITIFLIAVVSIILISPMNVMFIILTYRKESGVCDYDYKVIFSLFILNHLQYTVNPLICFVLDESFRKGFKHMGQSMRQKLSCIRGNCT
jgi:hypothetical protein